MGQTDIPLNETGIAQAKVAAQNLKHIKFSSIAVSPLARAKVTAEIISAANPTPVSIVHDLKECGWGIREGHPKGDGAWLRHWRQDKPIDQAELFSDFSKRVLVGLTQALTLPGPVLIVAHGGVYWAIQKALGLPFIDLPNCQPIYHEPPKHSTHPWTIYEGKPLKFN
ncbi:MAG: histidine phosphatase family protein [Alphaproteobacteria bacterium]|nr:histidine phosphatase family protein [Alphaproteobacteria bacterium]